MDYGSMIRRLECKVCFLPYDSQENRPKLLPCGHSLCKECLVSMLSRNRSFIECPIDRREHSLSSVEVCPDNYDLLEALQAVELSCSQHSQLLAVTYCNQQCITLCQNCAAQHKCDADFSVQTTDLSNLLQRELGNEPKTAQWDNRAKLVELQKRRKQLAASGVSGTQEKQLVRFRELLPTRPDLGSYGWKLSVNPRRIEAAVVSVSRNIVLAAFGLGRPIDTQKPTSLLYFEVYSGNEKLYSMMNIPIQYSTYSKEQKIPLSTPLPLVANQAYTVKMKAQGSPLYNGRPRSLVSPLLSDDGVQFDFSEAKVAFPEVVSGPSSLGGPLLSLYYY